MAAEELIVVWIARGCPTCRGTGMREQDMKGRKKMVPCNRCQASGVLNVEWVPLSELKRMLEAI
jgi:DnaJ-class molecular chaperone